LAFELVLEPLDVDPYSYINLVDGFDDDEVTQRMSRTEIDLALRQGSPEPFHFDTLPPPSSSHAAWDSV
jgi:hypothetical protein